MDEREITTTEEVNEETEETGVEQKSGLNTGLAMLIGGAIALGAGAAVKKVVKIVKNRKAAKQLTTVEIDDIDEEFDDPTESEE